MGYPTRQPTTTVSRPPRVPRQTSKALWVLYADTFTMAVGFYMLIPLLAVHFLENLSLTIAFVGVITAVRTASQNGLMPLAGWVADRVNYKTAIAVGVLIRAVGFAMLGTVHSAPLLVVASVLTGLGGALFHPASYAAYSALAEGRDPLRIYSTREMVSNLGFIIGPMAGGLLAGLNFQWVSLGAASLFFLAFVFTVLGLPSGLSAQKSPPMSIRTVLSNRRFVRYCALAAGLWLLISQLYLVVPVRAGDVLPGPLGVGLVYTGSAVLMVAVMLPLTGFASRHLSPRRILGLSAAALGTGIAVMGLWGSVAGLIVGVGIFTIGQVLSQPVMNAVTADFAATGSIASHFGVFGLAQAVGSVIGNLAGGLLYTMSKGSGPTAGIPWMMFLVWGVIVGVAFWTLGPQPADYPAPKTGVAPSTEDCRQR